MKLKAIIALLSASIISTIATPVFGEETKPEELNIFNWDDYLDPEIIAQFEKEKNCHVVISTFESNEEMLDKLQETEGQRYDIIVPSDFVMPNLINLKLLQELEHSQIPNMANLKDQFVNPVFDPENKYSVAYLWGTVGLVYSKDKFAEPVTSWKSVMEPADGIRFILIDSEREMLGATLRYQGFSINSTDKKELKGAANQLIATKKLPGFSGFEGNDDGLNKVISGEADIAVVYNGDALQKMAEHTNLAFVNPKEGSVLWVDNFCIPKNAKNPKLATKFINFILDAQIGAKAANYNHYATPNKAAMPFIEKADLENIGIYPEPETMKNLEFFKDLLGGQSMYDQLWRMVKSR